MDLNLLSSFVKQALVLVLVLSMPTVLVVGVVGLIIAFLQAVTQVQDQTMAFTIKLIAAIAVIAMLASWQGGELLSFANKMFDMVSSVR